MDQHFETFQRVYDERFQAKYGFWRPLVERSVAAFLKCGDLQPTPVVTGKVRAPCGICPRFAIRPADSFRPRGSPTHFR